MPNTAMSDIFLVSYQIGACASYIIFMADNLKSMFEHDSIAATQWSVELYMLCLTPFLLLIISVPNMKIMTGFSLLSNVLTVISGIILFNVILRNLPEISTRRNTGKLTEFPLFFGITLFAISAMGVLLTIEKGMAKPRQMVSFFGTLNVSMILIAILYLAVGFIGYWKIGDDVEDIITLNLALTDETAAITIQSLYVIAIFISYGLNGMVPVDIIWNNHLSPHLTEWKYYAHGTCITRLSVVMVSVLCAAAIPLFGDVVSLLGAFGMSSLELIFPALMHICVNWPNELGLLKWVLLTDVIVIIMGIVGLCSGTYSSIRSIGIHLEELRGQ